MIPYAIIVHHRPGIPTMPARDGVDIPGAHRLNLCFTRLILDINHQPYMATASRCVTDSVWASRVAKCCKFSTCDYIPSSTRNFDHRAHAQILPRHAQRTHKALATSLDIQPTGVLLTLPIKSVVALGAFEKPKCFKRKSPILTLRAVVCLVAESLSFRLRCPRSQHAPPEPPLWS